MKNTLLRPRAGGRAWVSALWGLLLIWINLRPTAAQAQSLTVPLGSAADYGLLSGGVLSADTASAVRVFGRVGVAGAVTGPVAATAGVYRNPGSTAALQSAAADVAAAQAYCTSLSYQMLLPTTNSHMLPAGAYAFTGPVTLSAPMVLTLTGDSASRFVIRVAGDLTVAGVVVRLDHVRPSNIVWAITGNLFTQGPAGLPGTLLVGGSATLDGRWGGVSAVLAAGNLTLHHLRDGEDGRGEFYDLWGLRRISTAGVSGGPVGCNLVTNPGFEDFTAQNAPTGLGSFGSTIDGVASEVVGWYNPNEESPDGLRIAAFGSRPDLSIPKNRRNCNNPVDVLQHTPGVARGAYAGIYATPADNSNPSLPVSSRREYIGQWLAQPLTVSTPAAPHDYYVEFWSLRASNALLEIDELGVVFSPNPIYEEHGAYTDRMPLEQSVLANGTLTPTIRRHDAAFNSTSTWSRTAGCYRPVQAGPADLFVAIGSFELDADAHFQTPIFPAPPANCFFPPIYNQGPMEGAYYFIDDVLIQEFPTAGPPVVTCSPIVTLGAGCNLPTSSNATYTWTGPGHLSVSSQSTAFLTLGGTSPYQPVSGTYTLTVSVPPVDGQGPPHVAVTTTTLDAPLLNGVTIGNGTAPTTVIWTTDQRIRGTVRVQPYATLIIDGANISFDDTRTSLTGPVTDTNPSRILVEPRGTLIVRNNALLTVAATGGCFPNSPLMWDGIVARGLLGAKLQPGQPYPQPSVTLSDCTIEHARVGVLAGRALYGANSSQPNTYRVLTTSDLDGGALVTATRVVFRNCWKGAYFGAQRYDNGSRFTDCDFLGTQVLADPVYQTNNERYGMQAGLQLRELRDVEVRGGRFQGWLTTTPTLRGTGIYSIDASLKVVAIQLDPVELTAVSGSPTFTGLWQGISAQGMLTSGELSIYGCTFTNNIAGALVTSYNGAQVRGNRFEVGMAGYSFGYGLQFASCAGSEPESNTFTHFAGLYTRGLVISQLSQPGQVVSNSLAMRAYRNTFGGGLYTGIYSQYNNPGFTFRCNQFQSGQITGTDLEVRLGGIGLVQGECDPSGSDPKSTANNLFSYTSARPSLTIAQGGQGFSYAFPLDARMKPLNIANTITQSVALNGCTNRVNGGGCTPNLTPSFSALRTALTANDEPTDRSLVVSALVRLYLDTYADGVGLDSAIAVLQAENNSAYQTWLNQLQARASQYSGSTANRGVNPKRMSKMKGATAERRAPAPDYFARVIELLGPLGNDSIRTAIIANNAPLREELVLMADDSLTWGSHAARTALNLYAGTHYTVWNAEGMMPDTVLVTGNRATALPCTLTLTPNPSDGHLTISYTLPAQVQAATLVIYDAWGTEVARQPVSSKALQASLHLALRAGFYHAILMADGVTVAKERLLLEPR